MGVPFFWRKDMILEKPSSWDGGSVYRGSSFTLEGQVLDDDFDMSAITSARVIITNDKRQNRRIITDPIIDMNNRTISVHLSQEDTLAYKHGKIKVMVEVKLNNKHEDVLLSEVVTLLLKDSLRDEVW